MKELIADSGGTKQDELSADETLKNLYVSQYLYLFICSLIDALPRVYRNKY